MEKVLNLYSQPYDARYPVIYMDEHAKPLRADTRLPCPARPGCPATYDYAYARPGTCAVAVYRTAGPVAHRHRHRPAHVRGTGRAKCRL